jgi:hypothetical protein
MPTRTLLASACVALSLGLMAPAATAQASPDQETFCKAVTDISLLFNRIDDEPNKKQQKQLGKLTDQIERNAPAEVADAAGTAVEGVRSGNVEDPTVFEAINTIDQWVADNCGYAVHDVTGRDYEFVGMPEKVSSGVNIFRFTNEGAELHELVVQRIKGDETMQELLELPEKQAEKKLEFVGATFAEQGATSYLYVDLKKPGRHGAVCFLPVGSTDAEAIEHADGPPHAAEGMATEFEVEKSS